MNLIELLGTMSDMTYQKYKEKLLKKRNQLHGLNEAQKEVLLIKWANEVMGLSSDSGSKKGDYVVPPLSKTKAEEIILQRGSRCQYPHCQERVSLHVHHITPRSEGGDHRPSNLIVLCPNHHNMADRGSIPKTRLRMILKKGYHHKKKR